MKIALVGPGLMPIPPKNWGGVENFIWIYYLLLTKLGHEVVIFNDTNLRLVINDIKRGNFDFVHLHFDEYAKFFNDNLDRPFCLTTHYGYINKPEKWSFGYKCVYLDSLNAPGIIALSDQIKERYLSAGFKGKVYALRVGTNTSDFKFNKRGNGKALCLGKIEPRKKQAFLADNLKGRVQIDFVGPIVDGSFKENETCRYLGVWDKKTLYENLTDYSVLILFSDGEAAPAVIVEALSAGLSLVISKSASANLDDKDFITVLDDETKDVGTITDAINGQIRENDSYRESIRDYAVKKFDNSVIVGDYIKMIEDFNSSVYAGEKIFPDFYQMPIYLMSRFYFLCSHDKSIRKVYDFIKRFK